MGSKLPYDSHNCHSVAPRAPDDTGNDLKRPFEEVWAKKNKNVTWVWVRGLLNYDFRDITKAWAVRRAADVGRDEQSEPLWEPQAGQIQQSAPLAPRLLTPYVGFISAWLQLCQIQDLTVTVTSEWLLQPGVIWKIRCDFRAEGKQPQDESRLDLDVDLMMFRCVFLFHPCSKNSLSSLSSFLNKSLTSSLAAHTGTDSAYKHEMGTNRFQIWAR